MPTATIRDLRYDFPKVYDRLKSGEEVTITMHGKWIGTLVPAEPKERTTVQWPDIRKRLLVTHGKRIFNPVTSIISQREHER